MKQPAKLAVFQGKAITQSSRSFSMLALHSANFLLCRLFVPFN